MKQTKLLTACALSLLISATSSKSFSMSQKEETFLQTTGNAKLTQDEKIALSGNLVCLKEQGDCEANSVFLSRVSTFCSLLSSNATVNTFLTHHNVCLPTSKTVGQYNFFIPQYNLLRENFVNALSKERDLSCNEKVVIISKKNDDIEELTKQQESKVNYIKKQKHQLEILRNNLNTVGATNNANNLEVLTLKQDLTQKEDDVTKLRNTIIRLGERALDAETENLGLKTDITRLTGDNEQLQLGIKAIRDELNKKEEEFNEFMSRRHKTVKELTTQVQDLSEKLSNANKPAVVSSQMNFVEKDIFVSIQEINELDKLQAIIKAVQDQINKQSTSSTGFVPQPPSIGIIPPPPTMPSAGTVPPPPVMVGIVPIKVLKKVTQTNTSYYKSVGDELSEAVRKKSQNPVDVNKTEEALAEREQYVRPTPVFDEIKSKVAERKKLTTSQLEKIVAQNNAEVNEEKEKHDKDPNTGMLGAIQNKFANMRNLSSSSVYSSTNSSFSDSWTNEVPKSNPTKKPAIEDSIPATDIDTDSDEEE